MMNHRNPAIKRIMADVKELHKHPSSRYYAAPLESDIFEWHFTIRGPEDTPFAGGIYHGRIILPAEYPFKPPNFVFLTKNGRFEVGTKICLSISAYHEESWQPAWGVRTMLEAIISFMPTEGAGAIGALDWTAEERKKLALESQSYCCPTCGPIASLLCEETSKEHDKPDPSIVEHIAQLHLTRQQSSSDSFSAGGLISDISATNSVISALTHEQSTAISDITENSMNWDGISVLSDATSAAVTTAIITAEEDVSTTLLHQAAMNSFENDPDNDCTLQQMINMEMDLRCASPSTTRVSSTNSKNMTTSNVTTNSEQSSSMKSPAIASTPVSLSPEPFTTETLAEIRKKRIAEKQKLQSQPTQQDFLPLAANMASSGSAADADGIAHIQSTQSLPVTSLDATTELGSIPSYNSNDISGNMSSSSVIRSSSSSVQSAEQQIQDTSPPPQPQPQLQQPVVPPRPQPPLQQQVRQVDAVAEAQRQRNLDRQNFNRIHWILNTLLVGTAGAIVGVIARILVRSAEISSQSA